MERLQNANMEDVMDAGVLLELKAISHSSYAFDDLEWPGVERRELAAAPKNKGLGGAMEKSKPHPITCVVLDVAVMVVVVAASIFFGLENTGTDLREEHVMVLEQGIHHLNLSTSRLVGRQCWRRPTIHNLKRSSAKSRVKRCIIAIFRLGKPINP